MKFIILNTFYNKIKAEFEAFSRRRAWMLFFKTRPITNEISERNYESF